MNVTEAQVEFIANSLEFHGLQNQAVREDIIDHICTTIEASNHTDFMSAYQEAIQKLGGYENIQQLQTQTRQLLYGKMMVTTVKIQYISGICMLIVFSLGFLFKMFHWPYANMTLLLGIMILVLIYMPLFFYIKYKKSILNYQS
ncbi:MAG: hypothetical protein AAF611_21065 [Bacteroidota bacterium]